MNEANEYLKSTFIADYWNTTKTLQAAEPEVKYRKAPTAEVLKEILSQREYRKINNDYTFKWKTNIYQIEDPAGDIRNQDVELRFYKDGTSSVYHGDRKLLVKLVQGTIRKEAA